MDAFQLLLLILGVGKGESERFWPVVVRGLILIALLAGLLWWFI
jgi:hypothetical protein